MIDLRKIIAESLEKRGMAVAELARQEGMPTATTLYRYLRAERDMTGEALGRVMDALGVDVRPPRRSAKSA